MFGGFLGGLVLGLWYLHRKGFKIPPALDAAAPGFALGVLIGRIGDIIIADHLGRPTGFFLGYKIPDAKLAPGYGPPTYVPGAVVHHTALYDLIGTLVLFVFMFWIERRRPPVGSLFATFALWYGLQRFVIDFTRNRTLIESHFFGLSGSQWAGLAFAAAGAIWLLRLRRAGPVAEAPAPAPEPVPVPLAEPVPETLAEPAPAVLAEPVGEMPPPLATREEAIAPPVQREAAPEPAPADEAPVPEVVPAPETIAPAVEEPVPAAEPVVQAEPAPVPEPVAEPPAPASESDREPVDPLAPEAVSFGTTDTEARDTERPDEDSSPRQP
jgi:hypothetical protein